MKQTKSFTLSFPNGIVVTIPEELAQPKFLSDVNAFFHADHSDTARRAVINNPVRSEWPYSTMGRSPLSSQQFVGVSAKTNPCSRDAIEQGKRRLALAGPQALSPYSVQRYEGLNNQDELYGQVMRWLGHAVGCDKVEEYAAIWLLNRKVVAYMSSESLVSLFDGVPNISFSSLLVVKYQRGVVVGTEHITATGIPLYTVDTAPVALFPFALSDENKITDILLSRLHRDFDFREEADNFNILMEVCRGDAWLYRRVINSRGEIAGDPPLYDNITGATSIKVYLYGVDEDRTFFRPYKTYIWEAMPVTVAESVKPKPAEVVTEQPKEIPPEKKEAEEIKKPAILKNAASTRVEADSRFNLKDGTGDVMVCPKDLPIYDLDPQATVSDALRFAFFKIWSEGLISKAPKGIAIYCLDSENRQTLPEVIAVDSSFAYHYYRPAESIEFCSKMKFIDIVPPVGTTHMLIVLRPVSGGRMPQPVCVLKRGGDNRVSISPTAPTGHEVVGTGCWKDFSDAVGREIAYIGGLLTFNISVENTVTSVLRQFRTITKGQGYFPLRVKAITMYALDENGVLVMPEVVFRPTFIDDGHVDSGYASAVALSEPIPSTVKRILFCTRPAVRTGHHAICYLEPKDLTA